MSQRDYKSLLQFSDQWFQSGLLTEADLHVLGHEYEVSRDKHTEHYRYGVFREYLTSHRPLSAQMAEALYDLGRVDPDPNMGGAMMSAIVSLPECPVNVLEKASVSGEKYLVKLVRQKRLLAELGSRLTTELFERCLASQDSDIQREVLIRPELSIEQLEQLAETGASRAVRNMAAARIRFKHDVA